MSPLTYLFIAAGTIMIASLAGVVFIQKNLRQWTDRNLPYLVTFSAGVFLVASFFLAREVFELSSPATAIASIGGGFLLFLLGHKLIPESHHHHSDHCEDVDCPAPIVRKGGALRMLAGDALHNIGDGVLLVPAFLLDIRLGIATAVSILVHEVLQEISEYFVLRHNGYSMKKALALNFAVSSTILIGIAIGLLASSLGNIQTIILGMAAGGFLYIVFHDLIPYQALGKLDRSFAIHSCAFVLGGLVLFAINTQAGHEHAHDDGHTHEYDSVVHNEDHTYIEDIHHIDEDLHNEDDHDHAHE